MQANDSAAEKPTAVDRLTFGAKTTKRVTWEAWEFTVVGPRQVEVTNASYGIEKDNHAYTVSIEERGGLAVPAGCECAADEYSEEYDCKHKVALATVGGPTVLNAAVNFKNPAPPSSDDCPRTTRNKLKADGGVIYQYETSESDADCECDDWDFPCWECYRIGRRDLPE